MKLIKLNVLNMKLLGTDADEIDLLRILFILMAKKYIILNV